MLNHPRSQRRGRVQKLQMQELVHLRLHLCLHRLQLQLKVEQVVPPPRHQRELRPEAVQMRRPTLVSIPHSWQSFPRTCARKSWPSRSVYGSQPLSYAMIRAKGLSARAVLRLKTREHCSCACVNV